MHLTGFLRFFRSRQQLEESYACMHSHEAWHVHVQQHCDDGTVATCTGVNGIKTGISVGVGALYGAGIFVHEWSMIWGPVHSVHNALQYWAPRRAAGAGRAGQRPAMRLMSSERKYTCHGDVAAERGLSTRLTEFHVPLNR